MYRDLLKELIKESLEEVLSEKNDNITPMEFVECGDIEVSKYPVTNSQYKEFVDATGHESPQHWENGKIPDGKENHPVVYVNYHDCQAFCEWNGTRLLTDDEWSMAAGDGEYPWGDDEPSEENCNFNMNVGDTTPVGSYPSGASWCGAEDQAGNVWEWVNTTWEDYQNEK